MILNAEEIKKTDTEPPLTWYSHVASKHLFLHGHDTV